jgi:pimeloyl-CoA dehydrogenase small subunit
MDFELSEDQRLLVESLDKLLTDRYDFNARKGYLKETDGWSPTLWSQYAELGLLGLPFAEAYGGFSGGGVDVMLIMEAFGGALVLEPYLATVVLGGTAIRLAASTAQQSAILPKIVDGSMKLAFAHGEQQARYDATDVLTKARRNSKGWVIDGVKSVVLHGNCADKLVVSTRTTGDRTDANGLTLFLVDGNAAGITRRGYTLRDETRVADLILSDVQVGEGDVLGEVDAAFPVIERVIEAGISAMAAEAVGAMDRMHMMTLEYLKTRQQFGKPIGSYQIMQHKSADMLIALEQGRSMSMLAAMMLDEPDAATRARNIAMAKVGVGQSGRFVSQTAIQLHGGIGMTEEYAVGHYFRRIMVFEHTFGDTAYHLARLADQVQ